MWQYWWWFWFTYYITVYYFLFSRLIRHRLLKFAPKIATSQKSHGKWGDFIICIIPITWCVNILSNSNFILRMLEWQTESSLFTIRVRGRQWYWVYKIELKDLLKTSNINKNLGHNYWEVFKDQTESQNNHALNMLELRKHNEDYLKSLKSKIAGTVNNSASYLNKMSDNKPNPLFVISNSFNSNKKATRSYNFNIPAYSYVLNNNVPTVNWLNASDAIINKNLPDNLYFVIKQKRFSPAVKKVNSVNFKKIEKHLNLVNNELLVIKDQHSSAWRWSAKRLKYKTADVSNLFSRRLLRTKRVLVLPTNANITVITNSFDVVHSWYIPGLGIKLDCIPGRSTHHTLYIDHAGFYYGQCAEICGRYHHHMPIRICALPFEHFMIWWYHYGLPYFNNVSGARKDSIRGGLRQYNW